MLNHMFAINNKENASINVVMEYKGYTLSLVFDKSFTHKGESLNRTELMICKGDDTVTYKFFPNLKDEDGGNDHQETVSGVTLDTLAEVKTMIDNGKIDEEITAMANTEKKRMPYITVYSSIGGWKSVLMGWDEEMEGYVPYQTGFFGYDDKTKAEDDARDWADAEEVELKL